MRVGILKGMEIYDGDKTESYCYVEAFLSDKYKTLEMLEKDAEFDMMKMKRSRDSSEAL